jgi:Zn finger protein HypA/HybF involved in hydrogenase expression
LKNSSSDKHIKFACSYLQDIKQLLKENFGGPVEYSEDPGPGVYSVLSRDVTIFYTTDDNHFFVTFQVGTTCYKAGQIVKLISLVLKFPEFTMLEDSFFDMEAERLVFGERALEKKQEDIRHNKGQCKCPICEGVYQKKYFKDGYCLNCNEIQDTIVFH